MYFQSKSVDVLARKYLNHLSSEVGVNLESGLGRQLIDVGVEQVVLKVDLLEQHAGVEQVGLIHVDVVGISPQVATSISTRKVARQVSGWYSG